MNYFRVLAQMLQDEGRGRDTVLAHITPEEAALLKRRGGRGSVNPVTGLLEFEDGDGGTGGGSSGDGGGDGGDSSPGGGDGGYQIPGGGYEGVFVPGMSPGSGGGGSGDSSTTEPRSLVSRAFLDMLERNKNLPAPTVSFFSNYAPRTVTPAAPLLNGTWVPISGGQAPSAPMVFSGDLGGYRGGGSFGAVQSPAVTAPAPAPVAPLSPSAFRAPSVTPDQVSAIRSPASEGLSAYADYLRRIRGY